MLRFLKHKRKYLVFLVIGVGLIAFFSYTIFLSNHNNRGLSSAIVSRDLELVKRKIESGCDVNAKGLHGRTMLTTVCILPPRGELAEPRELAQISYDILKLLLEHGATKTLNELDRYGGMAPIHYLSSPSYYYPEDQVKLLMLLISNGADINIKDRKGNTPLHLAVRYHAPNEIIMVLVEHGADVNAKTKTGETPLQLAINDDNTQIIEFLRKHGAEE
jgi:ankyrin repeat protein